MIFLYRKVLISLIFLLFTTNLVASVASRQLRYLSFMIRDQPPSVSEAQDLANGVRTLEDFVQEWSQSTQFQQRLLRFFNDWFGIGEEVEVLEFNHYLTPNASGVLHQPNKGDCAASNVVQTPAWWLEKGQTVAVCSNMVSSEVVFGSDTAEERYCPGGGDQGILHADCGCGPHMILCLPASLRYEQRESLRAEFKERAVYAFQNQLSWQELLGGDFFYGNRYLYHMYLFSAHLGILPRNPTAAELDVLYSLPLTTPERRAFPNTENLRAGVVTAPAFLQQFNNFRSRIRALSNTLLCRDIDGSLNTDGIATFVNTDLSDFDRQHGDDEGCAACHYPMDNMGSMLLGWGPNGYLQRWKNLSQVGHVFGQGGTGPRDLMLGIVERGPGFYDCMGRRSWEDLTGESWDHLGESRKSEILSAAQESPYALIMHIVTSSYVAQNRSASATENNIVSSEKPRFETVSPILTESCAGSACHSSGTSLGSRYEYLDNESNFGKAPMNRLSDMSMPPTSSDKRLSDENRAVLIRFLSP